MINLILLLQNFQVSMQVNHKAVNHPFIEQQVFIQVRSITMKHYTYSSNWKIVNSWSHMNEIYLSKPLYVRSDNHFYVCWILAKCKPLWCKPRICSWNSTWVYATKIQKKGGRPSAPKHDFTCYKKDNREGFEPGTSSKARCCKKKKDNIARFKPGSPSFKLH